MRIIGGTHKGRLIKPPVNLPIRPTTDFAKEGLFNILSHLIEIEGMQVCDLFAGTGSLSFEFRSRGAMRVVSVDDNIKCVSFIKSESVKLNLSSIFPLKMNVFSFLDQTKEKFNLIFADPPYDLMEIPLLHEKIFKNDLLVADGILIIEHPKQVKMDQLTGFFDHRAYGNVNFSFFRKIIS